MLFSVVTATLLLSPLLAWAQAPPGFIYQSQTTLIVNYAGRVIDVPGSLLSASDSVPQPTIGLQQNTTTGPFVFIMVDPSISNKDGVTDGLHIVQADLYLDSAPTTIDGVTFYPLNSSSQPVAPYRYPTPLVGSSVHNFTELLFEQPQDLHIPTKYAWYWTNSILTRLDFPLQEFVEEVSLGNPVAANYFCERRIL